ncbi:alpha/beta hydrolase [Streptomyces liangshanensis]|uniref:Alpha/beta hydrolase n=1 Tax=Streptomyces liangshanensis TaxID=2717324 RepID=A0A6G9GTF1_9ACTN|nr:alpha/beta hydrolase [Streptomyces liangshanensis]
MTSSAACWWRVADEMAAAGWVVTAPDLRGHGDAPRTVRYDIAGFAADVLDLTPPSPDGAPRPWDLVVGHSLGGVVATAAAGTEPGWAARLLLVDPVITVATDLAAEVTAELDASQEALSAANPLWHPEDAFLKAQAARQTTPHVVESFFRHNVPWSYEETLAATACPVTVLAADPDRGPTFTAAEGLRLAAAKADFTWSTVPGAGHSVHRDNPEAVVAAALAGQAPH